MKHTIHLIPSVWIFVWYLLYELGITLYNPKFLLTIAFILNTLMIFHMIYIKCNFSIIISFSIINFFIKVIPLWRLRNTKTELKDAYGTVIMFILYFLWLDFNNINFILYMEKCYNNTNDCKNNGGLLLGDYISNFLKYLNYK